ncbi:MAG: hypothetical protein ACPG31_09570, partial [Planctomycetota bacterium]
MTRRLLPGLLLCLLAVLVLWVVQSGESVDSTSDPTAGTDTTLDTADQLDPVPSPTGHQET